MNRLNDVMLKLMEGRPGDLTPIECMDAVSWLAEWDRLRPKASGRPKQDHSSVALHYWALIDLRRAVEKNAKADVGRAWQLSPKRVGEIAKMHETDARALVAGFTEKPDAFLRVMETLAARTPKKRARKPRAAKK